MTTAITSVCYAQTAPAPQPGGQQPTPPTAGAPAPQQPTAGAQPQPATPRASSSNFGTVYATEPAKPSVALAQSGLTASPTDYGALLQKAAAQTTATTGLAEGLPFATTPGGVTGADIGGGYMINEQAVKSRSTVTRDAIDKLSPTANPYQMINLLPGVVQSSVDNTGLNGGNIKIRGFNSDHLGLTIEGMPVNNSGNYALYPQEYVDAENISQISIAQGAPDLNSPHIGATGGVINIFMRDPSKTPAVLSDVSVGSDGLLREFARVESGEIDNVRAYVSYSNLTKDHWIGPGEDAREHLDFKIVWDLSAGNTIRFSAIYNHGVNDFYGTPTLAQFNQHVPPSAATWGYSATLPSSFFTPNASGVLNQSSNSAKYTQEYGVNPFDNLILSAPSNFTISKDLKFDTTPYFWYGWGNGGGVTSVTDTMYWGDLKITNLLGGSKNTYLYYNPSITETYRPGVENKFTYDYGSHQFIAGNWFEYAMHRQTGPFEALNADGSVPDVFVNSNQFSLPSYASCAVLTGHTSAGNTYGASSPGNCPTGPMEKRDQLTDTMTNMLFVGDTWKATDRLTLIYGVKEVFVNRDTTDYMPGANPGTGSYNDTATLPSVGARYKLNDENQLFTSFNTSFRSGPNYTLVQSYSSTSGVITPASPIPPEEGKTFELGHRYQGDLFSTSVTGFLGYYQNYQVSTNVADPAGSSSTFGITVNAGDLLNYGVDAEIGTRRFHDFRAYVSGELLQTELLDNAIATTTTTKGITDYLVTKGKELPGAPPYQTGIGIDYDNGNVFGNLAYKYMGPEYSTFMNDQQMKAFGRMDFSIGYRFDDLWGMKSPELKLSLFNILDSRQLTGVYSITNNANATTTLHGYTASGSSPTYYLGQDISGLVTFRVGL